MKMLRPLLCSVSLVLLSSFVYTAPTFAVAPGAKLFPGINGRPAFVTPVPVRTVPQAVPASANSSTGSAVPATPAPSVATSPAAPVPAAPRLVRATDFGAGVFRGIGMGFAIPLTEKDYKELAATGATITRVFVQAYRDAGKSTYTLSALQKKFLDDAITYGAKYHFKVVVVLQPEPSGPGAEYWHNADYQNGIIDMWRRIATLYKGNTTIAGYDLLNEPVPETPSLWADFATRMLLAIRAIDPGRTVIYEPAPWAVPSSFGTATPPALSERGLQRAYV